MAVQLRLYNTLTRSKEVFHPIDPENVRLYVCGPTVYDYAHIGNARPIIVFDLLFRLLRHVYGNAAVTYVRNITDVDDKINARAARDYPGLAHNEAIREVTAKTEEQFHADIRALGVLMPEDVNEAGKAPRFVEPRATEHIDEMRMIIERLIARGTAYVAEEHVLFSVAAMQNLPNVPKYGAFSKRSLDELLSGARVDVAPYKRDPMDFVLWKPSGPTDPAWASPGRHRDAGPSRLAHRVLGHVVEASGPGLRDAAFLQRSDGARDLRHPWRRHRPRLPAPRERDRPVLLRLRHAAHGQCVDAQRLPAGGRREDVEVARQLLHHQRAAAGLARRGACASTCCAPITASPSTGR